MGIFALVWQYSMDLRGALKRFPDYHAQISRPLWPSLKITDSSVLDLLVGLLDISIAAFVV